MRWPSVAKKNPADQVDALGATIEEGKRSLEDALKVQDTPIKQVLLDCGVFEEDKETHVVQLSKAATEFFALASGRVQSQVESRNNSAVAKLRKIVASTNMLLAQVSVADEKEFRKKNAGDCREQAGYQAARPHERLGRGSVDRSGEAS